MNTGTVIFTTALLASGSISRALDQNGNQQSDVWEIVHGVSGLAASGDLDGDGWNNAVESTAGTDPADHASFPRMEIGMDAGLPSVSWQCFPKRHHRRGVRGQSRLRQRSGGRSDAARRI